MSAPTIGRIVHYTLSSEDAEKIIRRRGGSELGGNVAVAGDVYPAVVVRVFGGEAANLQVWLDGEDTYWATSRIEGDEPGQWFWPPRA